MRHVMKITSKRFLILHTADILIVSLLCFLNCSKADAVVQPDATTNTSIANEIPQTEKHNNFTYRIEGRLDPFMPFISDKTDSTFDPNEIIESGEPLTGMQLFEPGQLTLVALVDSQGQKFGMVQDVTGKGYILKEGTKIGRRGVVRSITPNKVLIEEIAMTRAGKKLSTDIIMILRKEEKEK
jgi:hypothetical protein